MSTVSALILSLMSLRKNSVGLASHAPRSSPDDTLSTSASHWRAPQDEPVGAMHSPSYGDQFRDRHMIYLGPIRLKEHSMKAV